MRKTWKKKVMKRRVAISGGRDAVTDFVQGGVKLTPPPVKIGLSNSQFHFIAATYKITASIQFQMNAYCALIYIMH